MTNKTYDQLVNENNELKAMIENLITDKIFNVTTRQGLSIKLAENENNIKFVCFIDVDFMHTANETYGYELVNDKIKNSLSIRSNDVLIKSRWFSGDEIVIVMSEGNPELFLNRLSENFVNNGLSITSSFTGYTGNIENDVTVCSDKVQSSKKNNQRGIIAK